MIFLSPPEAVFQSIPRRLPLSWDGITRSGRALEGQGEDNFWGSTERKGPGEVFSKVTRLRRTGSFSRKRTRSLPGFTASGNTCGLHGSKSWTNSPGFRLCQRLKKFQRECTRTITSLGFLTTMRHRGCPPSVGARHLAPGGIPASPRRVDGEQGWPVKFRR